MRGIDILLRRLFAAFFKCRKRSQGLHIYVRIYRPKNHRTELAGNQKRRRFVTPSVVRGGKKESLSYAALLRLLRLRPKTPLPFAYDAFGPEGTERTAVFRNAV